MKKCIKCKVVKTLDCFYNNKRTKDGKNYYCKACEKIRHKKYKVYDSNETRISGLKKASKLKKLASYGQDIVDCMEEYDKNYVDHEAIREFEELGIL